MLDSVDEQVQVAASCSLVLHRQGPHDEEPKGK